MIVWWCSEEVILLIVIDQAFTQGDTIVGCQSIEEDNVGQNQVEKTTKTGIYCNA